MRFQRHAKIFRGQLDPAPVAGVFFLLVIFVILGNLLYTPGVLLQLRPGDPVTDQVITLSRTGTITFATKSYKSSELEQLRADLKNAPSGKPLRLKMEAGASAKLRDQIRDMLLIEPPMATNMIGTDNPVMIVAVNLRGQFFFENQLIQEQALREQLKTHLKEAVRNSKSLTLVLLMDKGVPEETTVKICALASEVGIKEVLLSTRPGVFSMRPSSKSEP